MCSVDINDYYKPQIDIPPEILNKIFGYISYDDTSKIRVVCKQFNAVGSQCLNAGFLKAIALKDKILKKIKDQLPRRESERRKHSLFPRHDALQGLDTRLSLLKMTYCKYIVCNRFCFIPGKVLDEIFAVLCLIDSASPLPSTAVLLQEVRDISSMAMEHFDDLVGIDSPDSESSFGPLFNNSSASDSSKILGNFSVETLSSQSSPIKQVIEDLKTSVNRISTQCQTDKSTYQALQNTGKTNPEGVAIETNLNTWSFRLLQVVRQRQDIRRLKREMSQKNRNFSRLESTMKHQLSMLHEVQSQLGELTTQMQSLQGILSQQDSGLFASVSPQGGSDDLPLISGTCRFRQTATNITRASAKRSHPSEIQESQTNHVLPSKVAKRS